MGKILEINPKSLLCFHLNNLIYNPLGPISDRMALHNRQELKREYIDVEWKSEARRFRLDSAAGYSPEGQVWETLFLLQEAAKTSKGDEFKA